MGSGGHCFAGFSSARGVVRDVTPLQSVAVGGGVVRVGTGVRLGELYERLPEHGLIVPAGICPSVGIGGLTLGDGHGILRRAYVLTLDHLIGAQVMLADGWVAACDEYHDGDLFWALRGAGAGNFGVVTSLTFRSRPAPAGHLAGQRTPGQDRSVIFAPGQEPPCNPNPDYGESCWSRLVHGAEGRSTGAETAEEAGPEGGSPAG